MTQASAQAMSFLVVLGLVATGCARGGVVKMLHERPAYAGGLEVTESGGAAAGGSPLLVGDLSFHRAKAVFQLTIRQPKTVSYLRQEAGGVDAFEDGKSRPASAEERERFELAWALSNPSRLEAAEAGEKSYRAKVDGRWYTLALQEREAHGWR